MTSEIKPQQEAWIIEWTRCSKVEIGASGVEKKQAFFLRQKEWKSKFRIVQEKSQAF